MPDSPQADDSQTDAETPAAPPAPRRGPGHRAADARDTAAEMAARAHEISLEAGSKMAGAMREVIGAAAGLSEFAIESARDLIHYMVRRGQMAQEEAEHLIAAAEGAYIAKHGALPKPEPKAPPAKPVPLGSTAKDQAASAAARAPRAEMPSVVPQRTAPVEKVPVKTEAKPEAKSEPSADHPPEAKHAPKAAAKVSQAEANEPSAKAPAKAAAKAPAKVESKPPAPAKQPAKAPVTKAAAAEKAPVAKPAAKPPAKPAAKPAVKAPPVKPAPAKAVKPAKAPAVSKAIPARKAAAKKK